MRDEARQPRRRFYHLPVTYPSREKRLPAGAVRGLKAKHAPRIRRILNRIEHAASVEQSDIPGMRLHPLKFVRKGECAMIVSGNRRITFRFVGEDATNLELEDYLLSASLKKASGRRAPL